MKKKRVSRRLTISPLMRPFFTEEMPLKNTIITRRYFARLLPSSLRLRNCLLRHVLQNGVLLYVCVGKIDRKELRRLVSRFDFAFFSFYFYFLVVFSARRALNVEWSEAAVASSDQILNWWTEILRFDGNVGRCIDGKRSRFNDPSRGY